MKTRKTDVCWDPALTRVEYLDAEGTPCYCEFERRATTEEMVPAEEIPQPAEIPRAPIPRVSRVANTRGPDPSPVRLQEAEATTSSKELLGLNQSADTKVSEEAVGVVQRAGGEDTLP